MTFYNISKLEAAKRQLECAVMLFFSDKDAISIHTLTTAAQGVLRNIAKDAGEKNIESYIYDKGLELIKPERRKEYVDKIREPQNFFKHGDLESNKEVKFNPDANEIFLFDTIIMYNRFSDNLPFWFTAYKIWFMVRHSDIYSELPEPTKSIINQKSSKDLINNKPQFIKIMREVDSIMDTSEYFAQHRIAGS